MATAPKDKQVTVEQAKILMDRIQANAGDITALGTAIRQEMNESVATMAEFKTYLGIEDNDEGNEDGGSGD